MVQSPTLQQKLTTLPTTPGVYFHKSNSGEVIYVGKAANLRNRVRQYFQTSRLRDAKTDALVAEIVDTDWIEVETELDALFLESEMIKRYMPRYNVLLRDDKSQLFVRIPLKEPYPAVSFTRQPHDDGATYYGPFYNGYAIKKALRYLRRVFPYSIHERMPKTLCLQYHLGLCPGVESQKISSDDYHTTLKKLIRYIKGERKALSSEIELDMKRASREQRYEDAARLRNRLRDMTELGKSIVFSDREFMDLSKDQGLADVQKLLTLPVIPKRIEGYDISHMSGTNNVASMVVTTNGLADKKQYRKFKMQLPGNNDFGHMRETMRRRFSGKHENWPVPDLLLIDGGKGQLGAALEALDERGIEMPAIGLAKRDEQVVVKKEERRKKKEAILNKDYAKALGGRIEESDDFFLVTLPKTSHIVKLLQRIRNESHRFAVSYHTTLKRAGATKSLLDDIPGVGVATRKKLIATFGSGIGVKAASVEQLVAALGQKKGEHIYQYLHG